MKSGVVFTLKGPRRPVMAVLLLVLGSLLFGACATVPPRSDVEAYAYYKEVNDPLEPLNRTTMKFNEVVQKVIIKPITLVYRKSVV